MASDKWMAGRRQESACRKRTSIMSFLRHGHSTAFFLPLQLYGCNFSLGFPVSPSVGRPSPSLLTSLCIIVINCVNSFHQFHESFIFPSPFLFLFLIFKSKGTGSSSEVTHHNSQARLMARSSQLKQL